IPYVYLLDIPEEKLSTYDNEAKFSKTQKLYNRFSLTTVNFFCTVANVDFMFNAQEFRCYERLIAWGYHPKQAIRDITNPQIGVAKIEQRLSDLHTLLSYGWTPRQTIAQWLNWALRSPEPLALQGGKHFPKGDTPERRDSGEYEFFIDEEGN